MKSKLAMMVILLAFAVSADASLVGVWDFDDTSDLTKATIGTDLTLGGTATAVAGIATGDGAARVLNGSYYRVENPVGGNGGGSLTNEFTLLYDFKCSLTPSYNSLWQTNMANSNDGDLFVTSSGAVGVSGTGYSANGTIQANTWHRLVVRVDNGSGGLYQLWVDGVKVTDNGAESLNGVWSLDPYFFIFRDDGSEEGPTEITKFAFWGNTLTEAEIVSMGDVTGAIVPEPATMALLGLGSFALIRRKK